MTITTTELLDSSATGGTISVLSQILELLRDAAAHLRDCKTRKAFSRVQSCHWKPGGRYRSQRRLVAAAQNEERKLRKLLRSGLEEAHQAVKERGLEGIAVFGSWFADGDERSIQALTGQLIRLRLSGFPRLLLPQPIPSSRGDKFPNVHSHKLRTPSVLAEASHVLHIAHTTLTTSIPEILAALSSLSTRLAEAQTPFSPLSSSHICEAAPLLGTTFVRIWGRLHGPSSGLASPVDDFSSTPRGISQLLNTHLCSVTTTHRLPTTKHLHERTDSPTSASRSTSPSADASRSNLEFSPRTQHTGHALVRPCCDLSLVHQYHHHRCNHRQDDLESYKCGQHENRHHSRSDSRSSSQQPSRPLQPLPHLALSPAISRYPSPQPSPTTLSPSSPLSPDHHARSGHSHSRGSSADEGSRGREGRRSPSSLSPSGSRSGSRSRSQSRSRSRSGSRMRYGEGGCAESRERSWCMWCAGERLERQKEGRSIEREEEVVADGGGECDRRPRGRGQSGGRDGD